jgi:CheY-like chemotaxis protein
MEAVGQLAGGIAHDFNNLLTIILAGAGVLRRSQPSELLEDIERAARSAAALTQRLLAFSRRAPYAPRAVDLRQVVEEIQPLITRAVGEKISTSFGTSPDACIVRVDVNQAQQALLNLAVNARDAMPEGGRLGFALERTSLSRGHGSRLPAGDYALVTVSDTGGGIDAAHLSRIFEPFFTTKDPGRGTGLGLTLVRGAMQQCGGAVTVESRPGAGCTFRLYFPLTAALPERHEPPVSMSVRRADVLLVEDDDTVRRMVADMLGGMGCRVTAVDGARAALAAWEAAGARYELLVTDVVMPGRHGDELAAELVARAPQLAVLFVTGYVDRPFDPDRLPRARVLLKPFDLDALRRVVAELLEPPAAARTAT